MNTDLVNQVVASILRKTFPVTVVSRDGLNVVLSQGGQALKEGARYGLVTMGNEMKDPQTGQLLGRVESPCCEMVVERVTPNLSYGRLENVRSNLDQVPVGGLQLREELKNPTKVVQEPASKTTASAAGESKPVPAAAPVGKPTQTRSPVNVPAAVPSKDGDKW